jgi:hypothetical protein
MVAAAGVALLPMAALPAQQWRTLQASRTLATRGANDTLRVRLAYAVGKLSIGQAASGLLYDLDVRYDADERRVK